jgi:RimJ/RimL family protein N-acetyltransferase
VGTESVDERSDRLAGVDHLRPVTLRDGRLLLRRPSADLEAQITAACQDRELHRWLENLPDPYTEQDARDFVAHCAQGWETGTEHVFAITDSGDGRLLGMIGLHDLRHLTHPAGGLGEIGFWTARSERGAGVSTGAVRLVCRYGFDELRLARIEWQAEVGNEGSRRVAEKVGFTVEGTCRQRLIHVHERVDGWLGGLLPKDLR